MTRFQKKITALFVYKKALVLLKLGLETARWVLHLSNIVLTASLKY